jgi:MarR family transcriptional regulator for hemolysin
MYNNLVFNITKLVRLKRKFLDERFSKYGLCRTQWQLLIWLYILGDNITQKLLLVNMDIDAGQLTRTLDGLESMQYIERKNSPKDRRSYLISMTKYAKQNILKDLINFHQQSITISQYGLKENEFELLNKILQQMILNFEQYNKII